MSTLLDMVPHPSTLKEERFNWSQCYRRFVGSQAGVSGQKHVAEQRCFIAEKQSRATVPERDGLGPHAVSKIMSPQPTQTYLLVCVTNLLFLNPVQLTNRD